MAKIVKLNVMLSASSKGLSAGIGKAQSLLNNLERSTRKMRTSLGSAFTDMGRMATRGFTALGAAAVGAASGLAYLTKNSIEAIGDANDFAKSVGLSYNQLRRLQKAAQLSGVDLATMNVALMKMSDVLGTAFGGNKSAIEAFEKIGLDVKKLEQMNPEQQFVAIAEAINKIQDPSQKIAAARDIFGRSGGALISFFSNVQGDMLAAGNALQMFGVTLSQLDVEKIDNAGDKMGEFAFMVEGVGNQLARVVSPWLVQVTDDTVAWVSAMGGMGAVVDSAVNVTLGKLDEVLNKLDAISQKWNSFIGGAQGFIGKGFAAVDEFGKKSTYGQSITAAEQEAELERRAQGIPAHRREAFKAAARAQGGFAPDSAFSAGNLAEGFGGASAERAAVQPRMNIGDQFKDWRAKADYNANIAAGAVPIAPPVTYKKHVANGYLSNIPGSGNDYESKVPMGPDGYKSKMPQGTAKYLEKMPGARNGLGKDDATIQILRNIEANTGKNKIAFAGPN